MLPDVGYVKVSPPSTRNAPFESPHLPVPKEFASVDGVAVLAATVSSCTNEASSA